MPVFSAALFPQAFFCKVCMPGHAEHGLHLSMSTCASMLTCERRCIRPGHGSRLCCCYSSAPFEQGKSDMDKVICGHKALVNPDKTIAGGAGTSAWRKLAPPYLLALIPEYCSKPDEQVVLLFQVSCTVIVLAPELPGLLPCLQSAVHGCCPQQVPGRQLALTSCWNVQHIDCLCHRICASDTRHAHMGIAL